MVVPDEVLPFRSSILGSRVSGLGKKLRFPDPYHLRAPGPKDVIYFFGGKWDGRVLSLLRHEASFSFE